MAVTPLFLVDMNTLKAAVSLSGATAADTLVAIDDATAQVKIFFYNRLGTTLVASLLTYASVDNPTTDQERQRQAVNIAEGKWVKLLLLRQIKTLFVDSTSDLIDNFNDEGLRRDAASSKQMEETLEAEINQLLALVTTSVTVQGTPIAKAFEPVIAAPRPWDSISVVKSPLLGRVLNAPQK